jgi:hypothetical protein
MRDNNLVTVRRDVNQKVDFEIPASIVDFRPGQMSWLPGNEAVQIRMILHLEFDASSRC